MMHCAVSCSLNTQVAVASTSAAAAAGTFRYPAAGRVSAWRTSHRRQRVAAIFAAAVADKDNSGGGGTGLLERPKFDQSGDGGSVSTESGYGAQDVDKRKRLGGGNYRVLLLDSKQHTEPLVVKVITHVVPGTDEGHARNCYTVSKELGMAIVTTCLKEHAEFFAQQMFRLGCRTTIEPDTSTV